MPLRIGLATCAHLHVLSYLHSLKHSSEAQVVGIWDHDEERGRAFAQAHSLDYFDSYADLLQGSDAIAVVSENRFHAQYALAAAQAGKHILCEKPLVIDEADGLALIAAAKEADVRLMTAFPCRFSPSWTTAKEKIAAGEIGKVRAIAATNRGTCPFGWFVNPEVSGGGAMIDHVVHVADLLYDLLGEEPDAVQAQVGNKMYGQEWEDTAMLTLQYPSGVFATLDSSWSRPDSYRTWGDVTMNIVGDEGVLELDLFGQEIQHYHGGSKTHTVGGFGSDLDRMLIEEFVAACREHRDPCVTGEHGLYAAKVALAGYRSLDRAPAV